MKTRFFSLVLLPVFICMTVGCGKKGPLVAPVRKIPKKAENVQVHQRGSAAVLTWSNPSSYIDGSPLSSIEKVEIYAAESSIQEFPSSISQEQFPEKARLAETLLQDAMDEYSYPENQSRLSFIYEFETGDINKTVLAFALKVYADKGKESAFSSPASLTPAAVPRPPRKLKVRTEKSGVILTWEPPEENINGTSPALVEGYNIYKSTQEGKIEKINDSPQSETEFKDVQIEWGRTYRYWVRAAVSESSSYPESADSAPAEVTPRDVFPPDPPEGVAAISGKDFVALSWNAGEEADLKGYRVWRKTKGEGKFTPVTPDPITETSFMDNTVKSGASYRYYVTAVDTAGNESPGSEEAAVSVRR